MPLFQELIIHTLYSFSILIEPQAQTCVEGVSQQNQASNVREKLT